MISKADEYRREIIQNMKGGVGQFEIDHLVEKQYLEGAGSLFARGTLAPGHSVGWHVHADTVEICYVLSGSGIAVEDDGTRHDISVGDTQVCRSGCGHEIINNGDEPLSYLAVVLYAKG